MVEAMATEEESSINENIESAALDEDYDPYPNNIYFHDNSFSNSHWFPTKENDFGLLFMVKFPLSTPDIVWDGLTPDRSSFSLCIEELDGVKFADLDAGNDFENLTTDLSSFECKGKPIDPIFL